MQMRHTENTNNPPIEMELDLACQSCGCHLIFSAVNPPGKKPAGLWRCCECGQARLDLADNDPRTGITP